MRRKPKDKATMRTSRSSSGLAAELLIVLLFGIALTACQPNQTVLRSAPSPVPEASLEPRRTDLVTDIREIREAGIDNIFVIRRHDGGVFDKDDRQFLRENVPVEMDRRISSDDGKAFILASKYIVPPETVRKWRTRFDVEARPVSTDSKRYK